MRQRDELLDRVQELEEEVELMLKELHTKQQSIKSSNKHISDVRTRSNYSLCTSLLYKLSMKPHANTFSYMIYILLLLRLSA